MKPISTKTLELYGKKPDDNFVGGPIMSLSKHLEELRGKILISFLVLCVFTFCGFLFSKEVIKQLIHIAPLGTTFLQIKPGEIFFASLRISLYVGLIFASPVSIWQLGSFILPGLSLKERKVAIPILAGAPLLFCIGSLFAYFFVAPSMLIFLFGFGQDLIPSSISIESFISFILLIMAICGCAFLMPILILALANVGIVNSHILINKWRHAILLSVILGAVLTPTPDPFNMGIVSGILITLYFLSWVILKLISK